jgi:hypothetical protein
MYSETAIREKLVRQRDQARDERDRYRSVITELVVVQNAPRSDRSDRASIAAWETARAVIWES